ncbi:Serine-type D-Ala-D-Ala carboxypeptidase [Planctomycetales bacterium 10988]|nr:Serine-type D-Ala-D-Ala carboxypeptidase [Planctomycetales bacterium 10988]
MATQLVGSKKQTLLLQAFILLVVVGCVFATLSIARGMFFSGYDGPPQSEGPEGQTLAKVISELRQEKKLVSLAATVMIRGELVATAAVGERKINSGIPVTLDDRWHLGSITKSITATMIGRLVESGQMDWDDTLSDCFPKASMHEDWKAVTLRQLLVHTSGAPANFPSYVQLNRPPLGKVSTQERQKAVLALIAKKPESQPGEKFAYSNVGYTIAGLMAEETTGVRWEELVKREVFQPLELKDAGFGPPKSDYNRPQQPLGHLLAYEQKVCMTDEADNTFIIGPAGIAHMSLVDLCRYGQEHLQGESGNGKLLKAEIYQALHSPELNGYACGWVKNAANSKVPHQHYWHNGSNTMWYALVVFIPSQETVIAVTSNEGNIAQAEDAAWKIVEFVSAWGNDE